MRRHRILAGSGRRLRILDGERWSSSAVEWRSARVAVAVEEDADLARGRRRRTWISRVVDGDRGARGWRRRRRRSSHAAAEGGACARSTAAKEEELAWHGWVAGGMEREEASSGRWVTC
ncbi:hypothetical protein PR202_gb21775 [Eleusine coracana subsp. coracana]|uniref:Uncharacterized protein n=1 Tax=Eleusine coracana subsp. coracana TaxID=191504 RepID=A0AAV5FEW4_ELECO|nr:hypothetical protein PR202_gb21775 [Eleusine coracana subsp. coracana]